MGNLKNKRKRNQIKKKMTQVFLGSGTAFVLLCGAAFLSSGCGADTADGDIVSENIQTESTDHTEAIDFTQATEVINETEVLEEIEEADSMRIVMAGDMLMHERIVESGLQEDGTYNFDHLFANVKDTIQEADLAIVNQETIMGGPSFGYTGYPSFNSPYELAHAEKEAGFDLLLLATNHALDKGGKGVVNCMAYLDEYLPELDYVGINHSQEEQDNRIYTYEANGIKVAVLNYTYGTNGIPHPKSKPYLVNLMKEDKIRSDIRKAEEVADFTILCPHWGTEYNMGTDSSQEKWVQIFLEEGVDLVLGAHPHVIEPIEWITDENGNQMLVYYSLGNFVNGTASTGHGVTTRMVGGIADVTIERDEETGEVSVKEYGAIPIVCHVGHGTEYTVYYMEDYTEEMASENLIRLQDSEFSKALCESIFTEVFGELFIQN